MNSVHKPNGELASVDALCRIFEQYSAPLSKMVCGTAEILHAYLAAWGKAALRIQALDSETILGEPDSSRAPQFYEISEDGRRVGSIRVWFPEGMGNDAQESADRLFRFAAERLGRAVKAQSERYPSEIDRKHMLQSAKMASLEALISGFTHEINNPVHTAALSAQNLLQAWYVFAPILDQYQATQGSFRVGRLAYSDLREEMPGIFDVIQSNLKRIESAVLELRDYLRREPVQTTEELDIGQVVLSAAALLNGRLHKATSRFSVQVPESLPAVRGVRQDLQQAMIGVLLNACESLPDSTRAIDVSCRQDSAGKRVVIAVSDEGKGNTPENVWRAEDPLDADNYSSGVARLALWAALEIVRNHGGDLEIQSVPDKGTTVQIVLPALAGGSSPKAFAK